jgi:lysozyme
MNQISENGLHFIAAWESFQGQPYNDGYGYITIGYGTRFYPNGTRVTLTDPSISQQTALTYLQHDLQNVINWINENIKCELTQNQFDAICSFFYNVGFGSFIRNNPNTWNALSSCNLSQFADDMLLFNHVNGVISNGLTNRRQAEHKLFNL